MNIRVEDLPLLPQNLITSGILLYVSNSGTPYGLNVGTLFGSTASGILSPLIVYTTGNQTIGGSKSFSSIIPDTNNVNSIDSNNRLLIDSTLSGSLDWQNRALLDKQDITSLIWSQRQLVATGFIGIPTTFGSVNWQVLALFNGTGLSLDWGKGLTKDILGINSIQWQDRTLMSTGRFGVYPGLFASVSWGNLNNFLLQNQSGSSMDWGNNFLYDWNSNISVDYNNRILSGNWNLNNHYILTSIDSGNISNGINNNLQTTGSTLYNYITGLSGIVTGISNNIVEGVKVLRTSQISFNSTGINYIYTVPNNYLFNIDALEIITNTIQGTPTGAPYIGFGNSGNLSGYLTQVITASTGLNNRDIYHNPSDAVTGGVTLTATIFSGTQGAANQSGFLIFRGYLMKNQ